MLELHPHPHHAFPFDSQDYPAAAFHIPHPAKHNPIHDIDHSYFQPPHRSPPSDQSSPSPPALPYHALPASAYHAHPQPVSSDGDPQGPYDPRRAYTHPHHTYSVSPPITPTDEPPFAPVHAHHDDRNFAFTASPPQQNPGVSAGFLGLRLDRRLSSASYPTLGAGEYNDTHQPSYSPRPSSGYSYPDPERSYQVGPFSSSHAQQRPQWDEQQQHQSYRDNAAGSLSAHTLPSLAQPVASSSSSLVHPLSPSASHPAASSGGHHPSGLPSSSGTSGPSLSEGDAPVQTATGAIINAHPARPVQTALPGVAVEVAGGLPTHPPVPVPPLSGPNDIPVLPSMSSVGGSLAGPGMSGYPPFGSGDMYGKAGAKGLPDERRGGMSLGLHERRDSLVGKDAKDREREREKGGKSGKQYAFVELPGNAVKKRPRRRYDEIERLYRCNYPNCSKAYGTLNHLNAHVTMQKHGSKRSPSEFKELRKQWRQAKKEAEEAQRERDRQDRMGMLGAGAQPFSMLHPVSVNVGAPHHLGQNFHPGQYGMHQQREFPPHPQREYGLPQSPYEEYGQGSEYEDYMMDRRSSVGYQLSPTAMYAHPAGQQGMGIGGRGSISSVGSVPDEYGQEGDEYGELDYPDSPVQPQPSHHHQQQWHPQQPQSPSRMHSYASPHQQQHPHPHQQGGGWNDGEPLLASHVSLGQNRLPPNSTLLTPYVPPQQEGQGQQGQGGREGEGEV